MGLTCSSSYVSGQLSDLETELSGALTTAASRVTSGEADAAMTRWFGDTSKDTKTYVSNALKRVRSILNCRSIAVGFSSIKQTGTKVNKEGKTIKAIGRDRSNAYGQVFQKNSVNDLMSLNGALPSYSGVGFTKSNLWLAEDFTRLPKYLPQAGGKIDSSDWLQSKFNTLMHELSHNLIGTVDCKGTGDWTAYGTERAEQLAGFGLQYVPSTGYDPPFAALYNAENWGIFVEAAGRNKGT